MKHALSLRFARSVGWSFTGQVVVAALNFALVPMLVRGLGLQGYGGYLLLYTASSYLLLLNLGSGAATSRLVAELAPAGRGADLRQTLKLSFCAHFAGPVLGAAALWLGAGPVIERVLRLPAETSADLVYILRCAAAASVFMAGIDMTAMILQGLQLFGRYALVTGLQGGAMLVFGAALVRAGFGVRALGLLFVAVNAACLAVAAVLAWRAVAPRCSGAGGRSDRGRFASYALGSGAGRAAWLVINQLDRVYIARVASLSAMTLYSVPAGLLQRLQMARALVANAAQPMMIEVAHEGPRRLSAMYLKCVRLLLWLVLPALTTLAVLMPQLLGLWLGGEFGDKSVWPARVLVAAQVLFFLEGMPFVVMFARDRPISLSALTWLQALVSVGMWKLLVARHGVLGVALGTLAGQAASAIISGVIAHKELGPLSWGRFAREALLGPGAAALACALALWPFRTHATTWPRMAGLALLATFVFYGAAWLLMEKDDRELLSRYLADKGLKLPRRAA